MFQVWTDMLWFHFAHKRLHLICFTLVRWQETWKASAVHSAVCGGGEV